jgi:hypothetical protein
MAVVVLFVAVVLVTLMFFLETDHQRPHQLKYTKARI